MNRKVLGWQPQRDKAPYSCFKWYTGYSPNVREIPEDTPVLRPERGFMSRDGYVRQQWFQCPDCLNFPEDKILRCLDCEGTGKLSVRDADALALEAGRSECSASDEDPVEILARRDLL
jgi:hypothetical protein